MTTHWKDVRCASIPVVDLPVLADLRGRAEIRVSIAGDRAWVWWGADRELLEEIVVRRILPLSGIELFTERGGGWYRLGEHLPAFDVPRGDSAIGLALERMIVPSPIAVVVPLGASTDPNFLRLVRDERSLVRPASALRSTLAALLAWAERATSAELVRLHAVWTGASHVAEGEGGARADVLVLAASGMLPLLADGVRFWGTDVLIPLGLRADPDLPETALAAALGAMAGDLVVLEEDGFERIARAAFKPLSRAGIRLAWESSRAARPQEGSRR